MIKIIYLVIASNNSEHIRDENSQRDTWAKNRDNVIWLRGGSKEIFDNSKRTLFVNVEETYENILAKSIEGIKWCLRNRQFDFLIRSNVSTYFVENRIESILNLISPEERFFGGFVEFIKELNSPINKRLFVNGAGIFMSRNTAELLATIDSKTWQGKPDDFAISQHLLSKNLYPTWIPRGNVGATAIIRRRSYYRLKSSENILMAEKRMFNLDEIISSNSKLRRLRCIIHFYMDEIINAKRNFRTAPRYLASVYSIVNSKIRFILARKKWKRSS